MKTSIINIYHKVPYDVYIGRAGKGQEGYFGNPYEDGTREEKVSKYREYFYKRIESDVEFKNRIHELKGKTLGCFCWPKKCHGMVIAEYLDGITKMETNKIICEDSLTALKLLQENSVSLIVTSPPYNVAASKWAYNSFADDVPYLQYIAWLSEIFKECYRVLRKGGRCIINIDAMTNRQEDKEDEYVRPIYVDLCNEMKRIGYKFFGEHIWYKSSKNPDYNGGQFNGKKTAWGSYMSCSHPSVRRNHEYILVFSKDQFKLEKDEFSLDSDITDSEFQTFIASTWSMMPETRKMGKHPVPFCEELPYRCIKLYSYPNDIVLDPFNGTGTTTFIANQLKRRYIGIDLDKGYCDFARDRIAASQNIFD